MTFQLFCANKLIKPACVKKGGAMPLRKWHDILFRRGCAWERTAWTCGCCQMICVGYGSHFEHRGQGAENGEAARRFHRA